MPVYKRQPLKNLHMCNRNVCFALLYKTDLKQPITARRSGSFKCTVPLFPVWPTLMIESSKRKKQLLIEQGSLCVRVHVCCLKMQVLKYACPGMSYKTFSGSY